MQLLRRYIKRRSALRAMHRMNKVTANSQKTISGVIQGWRGQEYYDEITD
jgi:hypothetical protein